MGYRLVVRAVLAFGAILLFGRCGLLSLDENSEQVGDLIEKNMEEWEQSGIESYRFTYNKSVGGVEKNNVFVVVREGQIDSVSVDGEGGSGAGSGSFLTIDRLYDEIVRSFERSDRGKFQVEFDKEFSYPERYRVGPGEQTEGRGVVVTSFSVTNDPS